MYRAVNNEKIGNLLVYLASQISELGITKLSKLMFLIDERAVKETGVPITWVQYEAWRMGPVPAENYYQIKNNENVLDKGREQTLSQFIEVSPHPTLDGILITPKAEFCDDEFSDYEIALIDDVINLHGKKSAAELVKMTHSEGSLWAIVVEKEELAPLFNSGINRTQVSVNLHLNALKDDAHIQAFLAATEGMLMKECYQLGAVS
jgi:uncharacterized phage-associated protein